MRYDKNGALLQSEIPQLPPPKRGKVRDIYDLGQSLLLVATDRISAFDVVMPTGIPDKGRVLTGMSRFWFEYFAWMPNQVLAADAADFPAMLKPYAKDLDGRAMLVRKAQPMPVECVARGYLIGSGWKDYQRSGKVCGIPLPPGYQMAQQLERPLFTPSTKAEQGTHDENISFAEVERLLGPEKAAFLRDTTLRLYGEGAEYARGRGIIIADTKFEFGELDGRMILIDEVLTADSSRFWPAAQYRPGISPPSLDKQFVRDYLEEIKFNKQPPGPVLPDAIVARTREKYVEALQALTGRQL